MPSNSLACIDDKWEAYSRARYNEIAHQNWNSRKYVARPISIPWAKKYHSILAISSSRLIVAAGSTLHVYRFMPADFNPSVNATDNYAPRLVQEGSYEIIRDESIDQPHARHDVSSLQFVPDGGRNNTLVVGFVDGAVLRVLLPDSKTLLNNSAEDPNPRTLIQENLYTCEDVIESLSTAGDLTLSVSGGGDVKLNRLTSTNFSSPSLSTIDLNAKSWSSYLPAYLHSPYAAFGTSSKHALAIHPITDSELSPISSHTYRPPPYDDASFSERAAAVYAICAPPPSFPSSPAHCIVSGWFDGQIRIFDLREPTSPDHVTHPVMTMADPWSYEPIYSLSSGGGNGTHIAAGSARHSVVAIWDVRSSMRGWSVHAPGDDPSPVYSLILDGSRCFGATERRAFVLDFGPGVGTETYPNVKQKEQYTRAQGRGRRKENLNMVDEVSYYTTTYLHFDSSMVMIRA
jgi:WD40 repeat protein